MKHRKLTLLAGLMICSLCSVTYANGLYYYQQIEPEKPKQIECDLVAYGSIRMEPVFMILGQSAGTAAVMAMDEGILVQDVDYTKLKARLLADKQKL